MSHMALYHHDARPKQPSSHTKETRRDNTRTPNVPTHMLGLRPHSFVTDE
jgi:hypothetical protein